MQLFDVINRRYADLRPTILVTNLTLAEIQGDVRRARRLTGSAKWQRWSRLIGRRSVESARHDRLSPRPDVHALPAPNRRATDPANDHQHADAWH